MARTKVTRGSQITLSKEVREKVGIREGDVVTVNALGGMIVVTKRDPEAWRKLGGVLPRRFERVLAALRADELERLRRLGVL